MSHESSFKVLFVCPGNICRSPALAASLQKILKDKNLDHKVFVDSCASTADYTDCEADPRMSEAAKARGILIDHRVKLFEHRFFDFFDLILAVNRETLEMLLIWASTHQQRQKIHLASEFSKRFPFQDVEDPYYGHKADFEKVLEMAEDISTGLLKEINKKL